MLPSAALRETSGRVTVAIATPKRPSGNCIRRNATLRKLIGPSPRPEANPLFTATFTCTALAAIVAGIIMADDFAHARISPVEVGLKWKPTRDKRRQLDHELQQTTDQRA